MYKILIVDDNELIRRGIRKMIERRFGNTLFQVTDCGNSSEALLLSRTLKPDIMISDIIMPCFSGLELLQVIRRELPDCRCIIVSGYNEFEFARRALKLGVQDYLLKPISRTELEEILEAIAAELDGRQGEDGREAQPLPPAERQQAQSVEEVIRYLEKNFDKQINLAYISNMIGKNYNYLSTLFKNQTGKTFSGYVKMIRIEHAKLLLGDPALKIGDVARMCGYENSLYFTRLFTQETGVSPSGFRKREKEQEGGSK